jgi:hypothetical protein
MNTGLPIIKNVAMAFAAEAVALFVADEFSIVVALITILGVMAVETPPWFLHDGARYPHELHLGD